VHRDRSGALYLGILLKRRDPSPQSVLSKTLCGFAQPASLICNPLKPRSSSSTQRRRPTSANLATIEKIAVNTENRTFETVGLRHATVDPAPQSTAQARAERSVARSKERHRSRVLMPSRNADVIVQPTASTVVRVR